MKAPSEPKKKPKPKRAWQRKPTRKPTLAQVARGNAAAMVGVRR
jgi:hypothetical protein